MDVILFSPPTNDSVTKKSSTWPAFWKQTFNTHHLFFLLLQYVSFVQPGREEKGGSYRFNNQRPFVSHPPTSAKWSNHSVVIVVLS